jgi:hypothetical protein
MGSQVAISADLAVDEVMGEYLIHRYVALPVIQ